MYEPLTSLLDRFDEVEEPGTLTVLVENTALCYALDNPDDSDYIETLEASGIKWEVESMTEADVSELDGATVVALLVASARADHFAGGILNEFCENGCVVRWLKRLQELDAQALQM